MYSKTMFEIYRDALTGKEVRVVYYTELDEHNKNREISRAMAGEHLFDGFFVELAEAEAKKEIAIVVDRLNQGETLDEAKIGELLQRFRSAV